MKFEALKDVIVSGVTYKAGDIVVVPDGKADRLVMLGFLSPVDETVTTDRAVKKTKTRAKKASPVVEETPAETEEPSEE